METPLSKQREYRSIVLENKLKVILIHDNTKDNAAAALSVHVGKVYEPKNIPGLAHFCEHMMSKGSEKYPAEGLIKEFVKTNGGKRNATTGDFYTSYMFEIPQDKFDECLDIYSSSFISPAFTESAVLREVNAVNNEHEMKLKDDHRRSLSLLLKQIHPDHPLHWGSGNYTSLITNVEKQGLNLREELIKFYDKFYSSNIMTLALISNDSLDDLELKAKKYFGSIPNNNIEIEYGDSLNTIEPFLNSKFNILQYYKPCKEKKNLNLYFKIPWQRGLWRTKPTSLICYIIGHEGENSLLSHFKKRGIASALSCYVDDYSSFSLLCVSISIVKDELFEVDAFKQIGRAVFHLIEMMLERIESDSDYFHNLWKERKQAKQISFDYSNLAGPYNTVRSLVRGSHLMTHDTLNHAFSCNTLLFEYDIEAIKEVLLLLKPSNCRIQVVHPKFNEDHNIHEEWYGASARNIDIPTQIIDYWNEKSIDYDDILLPNKNNFIPENLKLVHNENENIGLQPTLLDISPAKIYFRPDNIFKQPKGYCAFKLYLPKISKVKENGSLLTMWLRCIREEMNELSYEAELAGLYFTFGSSALGFILQFSGFNDKLIVLLREVLKRLKFSIQNGFSDIAYNTAYDISYKSAKNRALKTKLYNHAFDEYIALVKKHGQTKQERFETISEITKDDIDTFGKDLLLDCHVEGLCSGNMSKKTALMISKEVIDTFELKKQKEIITEGAAAFEPGKHLFKLYQGIDPVEANNVTVYTFQIVYSLLNSCFTKVLAQATAAPFSNRLRTQKQLGYICSASHTSICHQHLIFFFCIQSQYPAVYLTNSMENFINERMGKEIFHEDFVKEFEVIKKGCIRGLEKEHKSIRSQFLYDFNAISSRTFDFDVRRKKIEIYQNMTLEEFRNFVKSVLDEKPRIVVEGSGPKETEAKSKILESLSASDVEAMEYDSTIGSIEQSTTFATKAMYTFIDSNL